MTAIELEERDVSKELIYSATRSSGAGGQNVNKVNTRMELRFSIPSSQKFTDEEKALILQKLASRINDELELVLVSQTERTQLGNKEKVTAKFYELLAKALTPRKPRKATKPTAASNLRRLEEKKQIKEKKQLRKSV
jgi:ribosome-associated protein